MLQVHNINKKAGFLFPKAHTEKWVVVFFNWKMKNRRTEKGGGGTPQNDNSCTSNGTCAKSHMITIGSEAELTVNQLK